MIEFKSFADFPRGTMFDLLCDAYAFDPRYRGICEEI